MLTVPLNIYILRKYARIVSFYRLRGANQRNLFPHKQKKYNSYNHTGFSEPPLPLLSETSSTNCTAPLDCPDAGISNSERTQTCHTRNAACIWTGKQTKI